MAPPSQGAAKTAPDKATSVEAVIREGRRQLEAGRVLQAREYFLSNISQSPSAILHELGKTFDPHYLATLQSKDVIASPKQAASLYREAMKYGANGAKADLDRLLQDRPELK